MHSRPPPARIVVNDGERVVSCDPDEPLLFALMADGVYLPSACGGRASCGQCATQIVSPRFDHNREERGLIPEADRQRGVHLACQVPVTGEMRIHLSASFLQARRFTTRIGSFQDLGPDRRVMTLEVAETGGMQFRAGQYVQVILPGTEKDPRPVYRAYSISSPPSRPERLDLLFGRVPEGSITGHVFSGIAVGDTLSINGPFGGFHLRDGDSPVVFCAGGTGIAPFRAILLDMADKGIRREVTFFYVARAVRDLAYREDLEALVKRLPGLRLVLSVTHPASGEPWEGERRGMPALLDRHLPPSGLHSAYLCGSAGMIDASITVLKSKGLAPEGIFFDTF
jgi:Na+-transporting NADH:ubiquinone oxidoreductase subunit F